MKSTKEYKVKRLGRRSSDYTVMNVVIRSSYLKALKWLAIERDSTIIDQLELIMASYKPLLEKAREISTKKGGFND